MTTRLADDVKARRSALGLRQDELADLSGVSVRFVRALEHGKPTVRLDKVAAVLDALGLELRAELRRP
ncbi:MAG: helix-turn-helix transcriptional regulator [Kineosporiaceae bacterium]